MFYKDTKREKGYKEFLADIGKDSLSPVILLFGEERFLIEWAVDSIVKKYVSEATRVMDLETLDEEAEPDDILGALKLISMFSEKRVVHVRDHALLSSAKPRGFGQEEIDSLIEYLEDPSESTIAVFSSETLDGRAKFVKALKKAGSVYEMGRLDHGSLRAFAMKRFKEAGVRCDGAVLEHLIRLTGYENRESDYHLMNFDNDIKKLIDYLNGEDLTDEVIDKLIVGDRDTFIFDLLDGISANNKSRAYEILNNRLERDQYEAMSLVGSIASQLEIMLEVREYYDRGMGLPEIQRTMKLNEYRLKKALGHAKKYDPDKLKSMLGSAYDANKNIVEGYLEPKLALEMFVAGI